MASVTICSDSGAPEIKSATVSIVFPSICHEVMRPDAVTLVSWMLSFKPTFSLSSFTFIKRLFSSPLLLTVRVVSSAYLRLLIFLLAIWFQLVLLLVPHTAWLSFTELDKAVVLWLDWLVFCDCGFSLSALWRPLSVPTILLGFVTFSMSNMLPELSMCSMNTWLLNEWINEWANEWSDV